MRADLDYRNARCDTKELFNVAPGVKDAKSKRFTAPGLIWEVPSLSSSLHDSYPQSSLMITLAASRLWCIKQSAGLCVYGNIKHCGTIIFESQIRLSSTTRSLTLSLELSPEVAEVADDMKVQLFVSPGSISHSSDRCRLIKLQTERSSRKTILRCS